MKKQYILIIVLFTNLCVAFYLLLSMYGGRFGQPAQEEPVAQRVVVAPKSEVQAAPNICYKLAVSDTKSKDEIVYLLQEYDINDLKQTPVVDSTKHQVFWGFGSDERMAKLKIQELKTKGVFKDANVNLVKVNNQYALNIATVANQADAAKHSQELQNKAKDFGGNWFSAPLKEVVATELVFTTNAQALVPALLKKYPSVKTQSCS